MAWFLHPRGAKEKKTRNLFDFGTDPRGYLEYPRYHEANIRNFDVLVASRSSPVRNAESQRPAPGAKPP
jgi:hypothetical protein